MSINRRDVLKTTALGTLAGILPITSSANAVTADDTVSVVVLTTGLSTDMPFAKGVGADHAFPFTLITENYEKLVSVLSDIQGREVLALVEPAAEVLIEMAARDAQAQIHFRSVVANETDIDDKTWAQQLGETYRTYGQVDQAPADSQKKLLAIALRS